MKNDLCIPMGQTHNNIIYVVNGNITNFTCQLKFKLEINEIHKISFTLLRWSGSKIYRDDSHGLEQ